MSLERQKRIVKRHRRAASDDDYTLRPCRRPRTHHGQIPMEDFRHPNSTSCEYIKASLK